VALNKFHAAKKDGKQKTTWRDASWQLTPELSRAAKRRRLE